MINSFTFQGLTPEPELELRCQKRLNHLRELAPYGSSTVALLRKDPEGFHASIDIYSICGPFSAQAYSPSAREAVDRVSEKMEETLRRWKSFRNSALPVNPGAGAFRAS